MISQETLDQLEKLGQDISRDDSIRAQRSIDICWHWWNVGRTLTADSELYVEGSMTISVENSFSICEALGLSVTIGTKGRPNGEVMVRRAIDTYKRFPGEDEAKAAIEKAGTYHNLSLGTSYGSRLAKSMSVPTSLLDYIRKETGIEDKKARRYIARYLNDKEIQEDIVAFIEGETDD